MSSTIQLRDALYYPHIHIRNATWLKATLLCFPHVIRMTPPDFELNDTGLVARLSKTKGSRDQPLVGSYELDSVAVWNATDALHDRLRKDFEISRDMRKRSRAARKRASRYFAAGAGVAPRRRSAYGVRPPADGVSAPPAASPVGRSQAVRQRVLVPRPQVRILAPQPEFSVTSARPIVRAGSSGGSGRPTPLRSCEPAGPRRGSCASRRGWRRDCPCWGCPSSTACDAGSWQACPSRRPSLRTPRWH